MLSQEAEVVPWKGPALLMLTSPGLSAPAAARQEVDRVFALMQCCHRANVLCLASCTGFQMCGTELHELPSSDLEKNIAGFPMLMFNHRIFMEGTHGHNTVTHAWCSQCWNQLLCIFQGKITLSVWALLLHPPTQAVPFSTKKPKGPLLTPDTTCTAQVLHSAHHSSVGC